MKNIEINAGISINNSAVPGQAECWEYVGVNWAATRINQLHCSKVKIKCNYTVQYINKPELILFDQKLYIYSSSQKEVGCNFTNLPFARVYLRFKKKHKFLQQQKK